MTRTENGERLKYNLSLDLLLLGLPGCASVEMEVDASRRREIGTVLASLPPVAIATAWLGGQRTSPEFTNKLSVMFSDVIRRHVPHASRDFHEGNLQGVRHLVRTRSSCCISNSNFICCLPAGSALRTIALKCAL